MKSTIKIALGEKRAPVIEFNVNYTSDDLRDVMCKEFIYDLEYTSNFCLIEAVGAAQSDGESSQQWVIKPVGSIEEMEAMRDRIDEAIKTKKFMIANPNMQSPPKQ